MFNNHTSIQQRLDSQGLIVGVSAARSRCGGYSDQNFARVVRQICGACVEVIKRISKTFEIDAAKAFLPKRWMVERTFGWLNRYRRISKDYETHVENSEAMIYGSLIRLIICRFVF